MKEKQVKVQMKRKVVEVNNVSELDVIANELVSTFSGGELILCSGTLGVGKTALAKSIGKALGVESIINSPTFNILKVYKGTDFNFYHIDCYRLEKTDTSNIFLDINDACNEKNNIIFVEWPEFIKYKFDKEIPVIKINIEYLDENNRKVTIKDER